MSAIEKQCVLCGQSCAGQPRIKNEQGKYAHQACVKKKQAASEQPAQVEPHGLLDDGLGDGLHHDGLGDGLGDGLDADLLLGDLPAEPEGGEIGGLRQACPGCGSSLDGGSVVCMSCGFDTRSGKAMKTKVGKVKAPTAGMAGVAASAGSAAASGLSYLVGSAIGASIAGLVGAGIWAGIIIMLNLEIGWAAIGVGILCGIGAAIGARGESGMFTGGIAVLATVVAILAGKYFAIMHLTDQMFTEITEAQVAVGDMTPAERLDWVAIEYADEAIEQQLANETLDDATVAEYERLLNEGEYLSEYPDDVVVAVEERWDAMPTNEQDAYLQEQIDFMNEAMDMGRQEMYEQGFAASFGLMDVLFFLIAIGAAYGTGSGGGDDN